MEIKWHNVVSLVLVLLILAVLVKAPHELGVFITSMKNIGSDHTPGEQTRGLIAFGVLLTGIVALVKILTETRRDK